MWAVLDLEAGIGQCGEDPPFPGSMIESFQLYSAPAAAADLPTAEDHRLRSAWAAAWLREYRCHTRYLSLLALDAVEDLELRLAWLDWWNATCICEEASRRLERLHFGH